MSKATHKLWMHSTIFAYKMLLLLSYWSATEAFFFISGKICLYWFSVLKTYNTDRWNSNAILLWKVWQSDCQTRKSRLKFSSFADRVPHSDQTPKIVASSAIGRSARLNGLSLPWKTQNFLSTFMGHSSLSIISLFMFCIWRLLVRKTKTLISCNSLLVIFNNKLFYCSDILLLLLYSTSVAAYLAY